MASQPADGTAMPAPSGRSFRETAREWVVKGAALTLPTIVTLMVLGFVVDFVRKALDPIVAGLFELWPVLKWEFSPITIQVATVVALLGIIVVVGMFAEHTGSGHRVANGFHAAMEAIPGVGSVYTSFRRMSDVLIESDTDSFQDVKLVEFPNEEVYSFAFVTADTPTTIETGAGHPDMQTLFVPLAPNPVMGGFLVHVPEDRVVEVDVTVEEAVSAIVTSGVAISEEGSSTTGGLTESQMRALGRFSPGDVAPARASAQNGNGRSSDDASATEPGDDGTPPGVVPNTDTESDSDTSHGES